MEGNGRDPDKPFLMIENILSDAPRPGTPKFFRVEQVVQIVANACEDPNKFQYPVSHWTPTELAQEAKKRRIVEKIFSRSVERFLRMKLLYNLIVIDTG